MATDPPDTSAAMFDALPKAARQLLLVSAERATTIANGALGRLLGEPTLTPATAVEWHEKVLQEAIRPLLAAWETIEPADRYLAGAWAFTALLDQHLRQGEVGINFQRQHDQLPDLSALRGHGPAPPASPEPGAS